MIKKHQKRIALLVTLALIGLLQVSARPAVAASAGEQIGAANAEQGPRYIEEEGGGKFVGKKKSILPVVLIGVGVVAVAAVLFLVVLKTSYDIRGNWHVSRTASGSTFEFTVNFSGEKASGTFEADQSGNLLYGTYTADGKNVEWIFESGSKYTGTFSDKDAMGGSYLKYDGTTTGTWTATRSASAAVPRPTQSVTGGQDRD
jgi:hypothetical protein